MDAAREAPGDALENPAVTADAEQHVRQEIAGLRDRMAGRAAGHTRAAAAVTGIVVSGWLIRHWRRKRR
jgi:hypothetical protein